MTREKKIKLPGQRRLKCKEDMRKVINCLRTKTRDLPSMSTIYGEMSANQSHTVHKFLMSAANNKEYFSVKVQGQKRVFREKKYRGFSLATII